VARRLPETTRSAGPRRASRAICDPPCRLWHEHELSLVRRALQQLVRATRLREREALGHRRVDLLLTQQLEQGAEVLLKPIGVSGTSTHGKRWVTPTDGKHLVTSGQLLDPVDEHPPAGREQPPELDGRGRSVPIDPSSPALAPVRDRAGVAEHDKPSAGSQRAE